MIKMSAETKEILRCSSDIIKSSGMQKEKSCVQHGDVSVFHHSLAVGCLCVFFADYLCLNVDRRSLIRGALLHDYFLYDWHVKDGAHRLHGFTHAGCALKNAERDFDLGPIERDIIQKHMFPLNPTPPKYMESVLVCAADKICAVYETFFCRSSFFSRRSQRILPGRIVKQVTAVISSRAPYR